MTAADKIQKEIDRAKKYGQKFIGVYERSLLTSLRGETPIEAIYDFYSCYNSYLIKLWDFVEDKTYTAKENVKPDARGNLRQSWFDEDGNMFFNENEFCKPIKKILPTAITKENAKHGYIDKKGDFYPCNFECHTYLAKEMFLSETLPKPQGYREFKADSYLDNMGWVKVSSKRIHYLSYLGEKENYKKIKLTEAQKKTIINLMDIIGDEQYEFQYDWASKYDIEIQLNEL